MKFEDIVRRLDKDESPSLRRVWVEICEDTGKKKSKKVTLLAEGVG